MVDCTVLDLEDGSESSVKQKIFRFGPSIISFYAPNGTKQVIPNPLWIEEYRRKERGIIDGPLSSEEQKLFDEFDYHQL